MKKVLVLLVLLGLGQFIHKHYQLTDNAVTEIATEQSDVADSAEPPDYECDGRIYCSQMTSCEEATFFLQNCPGTKMDGDNDGIPCERQWC